MTPMDVAFAGSPYWHSPKDAVQSKPGSVNLRVMVYVCTEELTGAQRLQARVTDYSHREREVLYNGDSLPDAIRAANQRLAEAEAGGAMDDWAEGQPRRLSLERAARGLEDAQKLIEKEREASLPARRKKQPEPVELLRCPTSELQEMVPLRAGEGTRTYVAIHEGRPAICSVKVEPTDSPVNHRDRMQEDGREAEVEVFASPEERWTRIVRTRTDRDRDDYLREEMRAQYRFLAHGRGSEEHFDQAYEDAEKAIRCLPCEGCGEINWPVVAIPEQGSAEWHEDPFAYFACRECGRYLTHVVDGGKRAASREYPFQPTEPPRRPPTPQATM